MQSPPRIFPFATPSSSEGGPTNTSTQTKVEKPDRIKAPIPVEKGESRTAVYNDYDTRSGVPIRQTIIEHADFGETSLHLSLDTLSPRQARELPTSPIGFLLFTQQSPIAFSSLAKFATHPQISGDADVELVGRKVELLAVMEDADDVSPETPSSVVVVAPSDTPRYRGQIDWSPDNGRVTLRQLPRSGKYGGSEALSTRPCM